MTLEKLEALMQEFYKLKSEITSGEISIKRNYLLFKKYMLMVNLYDKYKDKLDKENNKFINQERKKAVAICTISFFTFIVNPLVVLPLIYLIKELKDEVDAHKRKMAIHSLQEYGIIENLGEIIYNKLMTGFSELSNEESNTLEKETHEEQAKELLTPRIYEMLEEIYDVNQESIGDVENYVIYESSTRKRTKTNHVG